MAQEEKICGLQKSVEFYLWGRQMSRPKKVRIVLHFLFSKGICWAFLHLFDSTIERRV